MSLHILAPGVEATIQAAPRTGLRHWGAPMSGPADPLSFALANRLLGQDLRTPGLEITLGPARVRFEAPCAFAVTGADAPLTLNGVAIAAHATHRAAAGAVLAFDPVRAGARIYLAVAGGFGVGEVLGSASTYAPAGLGGHEGRALKTDDILSLAAPDAARPRLTTPEALRPPMGASWGLRACEGAEFSRLAEGGALFAQDFRVGAQSNRMGLRLEGSALALEDAGMMASAPIFPGALQCPADGAPFLLGVDAQTTGGYPRIAQVIRADRHLIGQAKPGDRVRLLPRRAAEAAADLRAKVSLFADWLGATPF